MTSASSTTALLPKTSQSTPEEPGGRCSAQRRSAEVLGGDRCGCGSLARFRTANITFAFRLVILGIDLPDLHVQRWLHVDLLELIESKV
jgi:hypothetical protein